jgi:acetyltransferase-like isoleucine patch superfamily enzyme
VAFARKVRRKAAQFVLRVVQRIRVFAWSCLWTARIEGRPSILQPAMLIGEGRIVLGPGVRIGYWPSPGYLSGSCHIKARSRQACVSIGERTTINNGFTAIAETTAIEIGKRCMIGPHVTIFDTDFHPLDRQKRSAGEQPNRAPVRIGDDVFIGAGVTILKGVSVGDGAVLGANAVVIADIPADAIAAGNPARVLRHG